MVSRRKLEHIKNNAIKANSRKTTDTQGKTAAWTGGIPESGSASSKTLNKKSSMLSGSEYVSPLEHVRTENTKVLDPDTLLCRFELGGKCNDTTCTYQHCVPGK